MIECTYCGIPANALDHIIPVLYTETSRKNAKYTKETTVPCCNECNLILSSNWLPSISERAGYLIEKYNKKYKKLLSRPDWEDWEINELKGNLKRKILSNIENKKIIQERLKFLLCVYNESDLTVIDVWNKYPQNAFNCFK